jgi:hypothetical protein
LSLVGQPGTLPSLEPGTHSRETADERRQEELVLFTNLTKNFATKVWIILSDLSGDFAEDERCLDVRRCPCQYQFRVKRKGNQPTSSLATTTPFAIFDELCARALRVWALSEGPINSDSERIPAQSLEGGEPTGLDLYRFSS